MADIDWDDVITLSAALSAVDTDYKVDVLAYVNGTLNVAHFGGEAAIKTRLARMYLAAHFGQQALDAVSGAAGPVSAESAGGLSREYAVFSPPGSSALYDTTTFGKQYRLIVRASRCAVPLVT